MPPASSPIKVLNAILCKKYCHSKIILLLCVLLSLQHWGACRWSVYFIRYWNYKKKKACSHTPLPPYVFVAWCVMKQWENFYFFCAFFAVFRTETKWKRRLYSSSSYVGFVNLVMFMYIYWLLPNVYWFVCYLNFENKSYTSMSVYVCLSVWTSTTAPCQMLSPLKEMSCRLDLRFSRLRW